MTQFRARFPYYQHDNMEDVLLAQFIFGEGEPEHCYVVEMARNTGDRERGTYAVYMRLPNQEGATWTDLCLDERSMMTPRLTRDDAITLYNVVCGGLLTGWQPIVNRVCRMTLDLVKSPQAGLLELVGLAQAPQPKRKTVAV